MSVNSESESAGVSASESLGRGCTASSSSTWATSQALPSKEVAAREPPGKLEVTAPFIATPRTTSPTVTWRSTALAPSSHAKATATPGSEPCRYREVGAPMVTPRSMSPVTWQSAAAPPQTKAAPGSEPWKYREVTAPFIATPRTTSPTVTWRSTALAPSSHAKATATPGSEPCRYREVGAPMVTPRSMSPVTWQSAAAPPQTKAESPRSLRPTKVTVYPPVRLESAPNSSGHADRVQLATVMNGYSTPSNFLPTPSNVPWTPPMPLRQATPLSRPVNATNVAGSVPSTPVAPWTCYACTTRSAPIALPAKITVRWSPTAFTVPESVKEALGHSRTPSPQVEGAAQKASSVESSQLEERMRELERRLDAKEAQCKHLEEHLTEVRNCLEEQKQRGTSDLKQRDQHIAELNHRNQELIAAAKMRFTVVPDGEEDTFVSSRNESATSGEAFKRRGAASIADDVSNDKDMPTLAALRQRLYPKRSARQDKPEGEKEQDLETSRPRTSRQNGRGSQSQRTPPRRAS